MTTIKMTKIMVGGDGKRKLSPFNIDVIEKNTITITRIEIADVNYVEMEEWLTKHGATIIGYHNGYYFCPVYKVTSELKVIFLLRWS